MPERTLETLIVLAMSLFDVAEFRSLLRGVGGGEIERHLPNINVAPGVFFADALDALRRRGLIDADFFARLRQTRPQRWADIATVLSAWESDVRGQQPPANVKCMKLVPVIEVLAGWPVEVRPNCVIELGRDPTLAHRLPSDDRSASRLHARVLWSAADIEIFDLSKNGCWINLIRVTHAVLKPGDCIHLGRTELLVQDANATVTGRGGHQAPPDCARRDLAFRSGSARRGVSPRGTIAGP